jgi:hypothetical protein
MEAYKIDKKKHVRKNLKFETQLWYKNLFHNFHILAYKVANSPECCLLWENALDCIGPQL